MDGLTINIRWEYFLGIISALIAIAWYSNGRFTKLETSMEWVIKILNGLKIGLAADEVAPAHSPRKLNARGEKVLSGSGIKEIIDENKSGLLALVKEKNVNNPYDAEQYVLQVVSELKKDTLIIERLKKGAFSVGADIDTVLFVGGIYLRDLIFPELGFFVTDLDKPKTDGSH